MGLSLKRIYSNKPFDLPADIQLRFLKRLSRLLSNGYTLIEALDVIKWDKELYAISNQISHLLKNGIPIDEAFEQTKFHSSIIAHLYFIKINGDILASIDKCVDMFEHRLNYVKKFQQVIRYPILLTSIFLILLYALKQFILPVFLELFHSNLDSLSIVQLFLMMLAIVVRFIMVSAIFSIVLIVFWQVYKKRCSIKNKLLLYSKIPIYRQYLKIQTSFQFATHISSLLKSGLPIKEILTNLSQQQQLPIIAYYSKLMTSELNNGYHLETLISQLQFLDKQIAIIFQKNINADTLQKDLSIYADWLIEELHRKVMKIFTMIQPIFFVMIALLIILMYVMLMWPMFDLIKTI